MHDRHFCAPECFERAARDELRALLATAIENNPVRHRIPLGLLMLSRGQLTHRQLQSALEAQAREREHRLGEWLEKLGFATEQQVTAALGVQWACPVLVDSGKRDPDCTRLLPWRLLESFRMLPVQFVNATRTFYLAFSDGIDYRALYAIERMLDCRTEPCLVGRSAMKDALEQIGVERGSSDLLFEGWRDATEMARVTTSYIQKLRIDCVRMTNCGPYIWVRLQQGEDAANLLFRQPAATAAEDFPEIELRQRISS